MTIPMIDDLFCRSELGPDVLTLIVRTRIHFLDRIVESLPNCDDASRTDARGTMINGGMRDVTYDSTPAWNPQRRTWFEQAITVGIHNHWNGRFVLVDAAGRDPRRIRCALQVVLQSTDTPQVHLRIHAVNQPRFVSVVPAPLGPVRAIDLASLRRYRASCGAGISRGRTVVQDHLAADMFMDFPDSGGFAEQSTWHTSDRGEQGITQHYLAHEFGHYLGLEHTCQAIRPPQRRARGDQRGQEVGWCDSSVYCAARTFAQQSLMMAAGNDMHPDYADAWRARLRDHRFERRIRWTGRLV